MIALHLEEYERMTQFPFFVCALHIPFNMKVWYEVHSQYESMV